MNFRDMFQEEVTGIGDPLDVEKKKDDAKISDLGD